jgi:hypothetical protein
MGFPGIFPEIAMFEATYNSKLAVFMPFDVLAAAPGFHVSIAGVGQIVAGFLVRVNGRKGLCGVKTREHIDRLTTLDMELSPMRS